ncbi:MAG: hypothetical protein PWQ64_772 [Desulfomicrobiaceae bacterium]|nr:hypothetical protein [Desulfomicrobiaceae bacterium]
MMAAVGHLDDVGPHFGPKADAMRHQAGIGFVDDLSAPGVDHGQDRHSQAVGLVDDGAEVGEHAFFHVVADVCLDGNHVRPQAQGLGHGSDDGARIRGDPVAGAGGEVDDQVLGQADGGQVAHGHAFVEDDTLHRRLRQTFHEAAHIIEPREHAFGHAVIQGHDDRALGARMKQTPGLAKDTDHSLLLSG